MMWRTFQPNSKAVLILPWNITNETRKKFFKKKKISYTSISKIIKNIYKPDKLNIANLGNIVSQLHIHIIARYKNDNSFPNPVWIDNNRTYYNNEDIKNIRQYF